jgi:hypothetical protein
MKMGLLLVLITLFINLDNERKEKSDRYDIVIYGGTSAGVAAAIQSSRLGKSVVLIEPSLRIGGLTTGGLGQTDIGNKQAIGGVAREFYRNIRVYYEDPAHWKWEDRTEYLDGGQTRTRADEPTMWTFEPSAALKVFEAMITTENITLVYEQKLNRKKGVIKEGSKIVKIEMENGEVYEGRMFIDATYEGDLMAAAGVSYTVGRESNDMYGETLNGAQPNVYNLSLLGTVSRNGKHHNFVPGVDPYVVKGKPSSGLLPYIGKAGPGITGSDDNKIQAYCYRMCLTDHPDNRIPFEKPEDYNEINYELLFRNYEAAGTDLEKMYDYGSTPYLPWINSSMPNRKTDTNNKYGFSTDFIGQNYNYPEASYEEREDIRERHRNYQMGLMWTLANHPRIPEKVKNEVALWGTCKDEFAREDGWPDQLYIREARRMVSDYVMTQHNCEGLIVAGDPVGLAAYGMDSHHTQRYIDANGYVQNEGNVECHVPSPYPISYRSIIPGEDEVNNLLVPVCLSATHIAFGSIRMEPVFMVLGQSAATAASLALDQSVDLHDVDYQKLREALLRDKQILENSN